MNNFKKIFAILPLILGGAAILPSCSFNTNPEDIIDPDEKTRKITFGTSALNMDVNETSYITVNTSKCNFQSADFTITSTNPSVATVTKTSLNASGDAIRVDSHKEGVTSVTAHCKNVTTTCTVTVIDSYLAPIIKIDESAISIVKGTKYSINLSLSYKGEEVTDNVSYAYSCYDGEDAASLKITKGREGYYLTATALSAGNATYYITASYLDKIIAPIELNISVLDTVISYDVKNAELTSTGYVVNLYTVEDSEGEFEYHKTIDLEVDVYENGNKVTESLTFTSENPSIVDVNGYKLTGKGKGFTTISTSYKDIPLEITAIVSKPSFLVECEVNKTLEVEEANGLTLTNTSTRQIKGNAQGVYIGDEPLAIDLTKHADVNLTGQTITIDPKTMRTLNLEHYGDNKSVCLETDEAYYVWPEVNIYSRVINTYDELKNLGLDAKKYSDNAYVFSGYFVLGDDIDCSSGSMPVYMNCNSQYKAETSTLFVEGANEAEKLSRGFFGVFDGKRHKIDKLDLQGRGSFFTYMNDPGIIKNVAFTNTSFIIEDGGQSHIDRQSDFLYHGSGKAENVYIEFTKIDAYQPGWYSTAGTINCSDDGTFSKKVQVHNVLVRHCANTGVVPAGGEDGQLFFDPLGMFYNINLVQGFYSIGPKPYIPNAINPQNPEQTIQQCIDSRGTGLSNGTNGRFTSDDDVSDAAKTNMAQWPKEYWTINETTRIPEFNFA